VRGRVRGRWAEREDGCHHPKDLVGQNVVVVVVVVVVETLESMKNVGGRIVSWAARDLGRDLAGISSGTLVLRRRLLLRVEFSVR